MEIGNYEVTATEIPIEQKIFTEIWNTYKKYYKSDNSEEYWDGYLKECCCIGDKYKEVPLARKLAVCILEDIEAKVKKEGKI